MAEAQYAHNHVINPETGYLENPAYHNDFDSVKKEQFLKLFVENGMGLQRTCRALGMSTETVHKHYQIDKKFKEEFDKIRTIYVDELEATSRQNALNPRSVIERIFQLKALLPEKYGDKRDSSNINVSINIDQSMLEQIKRRQEVIDIEPVSTDGNKT